MAPLMRRSWRKNCLLRTDVKKEREDEKQDEEEDGERAESLSTPMQDSERSASILPDLPTDHTLRSFATQEIKNDGSRTFGHHCPQNAA
jgi:hypothetical protein